MDLRLLLNTDDQTVTFQNVSVDLDETFNVSGDFAVDGFGGTRVTNTISGTIDFDSPIVFTDDQALSLWAGQNNQFLIDGFEGQLGSTDQPDITGSYQFSGPTESVEGTFSVDAYWWRRTINNSLVIDTTDYPNSVTIDRHPNWSTITGGDIFSGTIDGVDISVQFNSARFWAPDNLEFTPQIIPEPSEYALMIGGLLIAFVGFRRRGFLKSV